MTANNSNPVASHKQCSSEQCNNPLGRLLPATPEYFNRNKRSADGLSPECKICSSERGKKWYQENKERRLTKAREWTKKNQERVNEYSRQWRENNPEKRREIERRSYKKHKAKRNAEGRAYHEQHKEQLNARRRQYFHDNREYERNRNKVYRSENKERISEYQRAARQEDPEKFRERVRRSYRKHIDKVVAYRQKNRSAILERGRKWYAENKERHKTAATKRKEANPEAWRLKVLAKTHKYLARKKGAEGYFTKNDVELQYKSQNGKCWWCGKSVKRKFHVDHIIPLAKGGSNKPNNICISCPTCNSQKSDRMPWEFKGRLF